MANLLNIHLGKSVTGQRERRNLSCEQLALKIGVSVSTMSAYEGGQLRIPVATLVEISGVLRVPLEEFFNWEQPPLPNDLNAADTLHPPSTEELAQLQLAFSQISSREMRDTIIQLIEKCAEREVGNATSRYH